MVLARRVRTDSPQDLHRHGPGVHAARPRQGRPLVQSSLPALRSPLHLRREHRHTGLGRPNWRPDLAQDVAAGRHRAVAGGPAAERRPIHDRHDLAHRGELRRRRRQQGPRVREVPRPAGAHPHQFELAINGPQALLRAHGWQTVDAMRVSRTPSALPRLHPRLESRVRRRQTRVRGAPVRLVQRPHRVLSRRRPAGARPGDRVERAPAARRRAPELLDRRRSPRRPDRIASDYPRHAARAADIASDCFDAAPVLPPLLETAGDDSPAPHRGRRARRDLGAAAAVRINRDADGAPDRRTRGRRPRRDALRHQRVATRATLRATFARGYREDRRAGRGSSASSSTWRPRSSAPRHSTSSIPDEVPPAVAPLHAPRPWC